MPPLGSKLVAQGDQCCASLGDGEGGPPTFMKSKRPFFTVQSAAPPPESRGSADGAPGFLGRTVHLVL